MYDILTLPCCESCVHHLFLLVTVTTCSNVGFTWIKFNQIFFLENTKFYSKVLSIKDIRSQGEEVLSSADKIEGGLQMRTFALFGASDFSKFMVCPHGQGRRGVEPVRTFYGQEELVDFS